MNIPETNVTRKQQFDAALGIAGMTIEDWRRDVYPVSRIQLHRVLTGEQKGSPLLNQFITNFIEEMFARLSANVSRESRNESRQDEPQEPAA